MSPRRPRARRASTARLRLFWHDRVLRFEPLEDRRLLATFSVTNLMDGPVAAAGDLPGSLRQAVFDANNAAGADTIDLSAVSGTLLITDGEFELTEEAIVTGPGQGVLTIDAQEDSRIFNITATTGDFTIAGLTLTQGRTFFTDLDPRGAAIRSLSTGDLTINNCTISDSEAVDDGGGIFSTGDMTLVQSTISGNQAFAFGADGGGVFSASQILVEDSVISGNGVHGYFSRGGGIAAFGEVTLTDSVVSYNSNTNSPAEDVDAAAGGIFTTGSVTLIRSVVNGNYLSHGEGGGIWAAGDVTVTQSSISGNSADRGFGGGGIYALQGVGLYHSSVTNNSGGIIDGVGNGGGGIRVLGDLTLNQSTVSGNSSRASGGIYGLGRMTLTQSTVSGNSSISGVAISSAHAIGIFGSIVAGNVGGGGDLAFGVLHDMHYSLIGDKGSFLLTEAQTPDANGNLIGDSNGGGVIDPLLGPLGYYGGLTETHSLLAGSPAIDLGDPSIAFNPTEFDQRGDPYVRVFDGDGAGGARIDMGAFEAQPLTLVVDTLVDEDDDDYSEDDFSLREAIGLANGNTEFADLITFHPALDGGTIELDQAQGELPITEDVTIDAGSLPGGLTIDALQNSRIFNFAATTGDFTITRLTLTGGRTVASSFDGQGGAIRFDSSGELEINDSNVSGNSTVGDSADGGGIFAFGDVTLNQSTMSGNSTVGLGADGGGIAAAGSVTLNQSTISGNSTEGTSADGGGVFSLYGALTLNHSTVTDNHVLAGNATGGGLWNYAQPVALSGSIVAGNTAGGGNPDLRSGMVTFDVNYSLIGDTSGLTMDQLDDIDAGMGNILDEDPLLDVLADNGGPTQTHALRAGSPAIDAGDPLAEAGLGGVPEFDQRGDPFGRVEDGDAPEDIAIDIGAFELVYPALLGDYNLNGVVDAADYAMWRSTLNQFLTPYTGADGSGNGKVNMADYGVWRAHFGDTLPPPAAGGGAAEVATPVRRGGATPLGRAAVRATAAESQPLTLASDEPLLAVDSPAPERAIGGRSPTVFRPPRQTTEPTWSALLLIDRLFAPSDDGRYDRGERLMATAETATESTGDVLRCAVDSVFAALGDVRFD